MIVRRRRAPFLLVPALALALAGRPAAAHDLSLTDVLVVFKNGGSYQVDMAVDLDALALGASSTADSAALAAELRALPPAELEARVASLARSFERRVRIAFDGVEVRPVVSFPERGTPLADAAEPATVLGLVARLEGRVPADARTFTFRASRAFPPVHLTVLRQASAATRELLEPGAASAPVPLAAPAAGTAQTDRREVAGRYLMLGFWHIVPEGLDHILFVLGLFLLAVRWRPLLWQVSAFTAAHTTSLALATFGVVALPSALVEPLIALSIAYVAIENLFTSELHPWRPWLVFAFGLLHGLGFAGVLGELGLPASEKVAALLAFNVGVELGQLAVLLLAFLLLGVWRRHPAYRRRVVVPLSLLIAAVGLIWAVERTFF